LIAECIKKMLFGLSLKWIRWVQLRELHSKLSQCKRVGENVRFRFPITIYGSENLSVGDQVDVGEYTHIRAGGGLSIGDRVLIAANCIITTRSHPKGLPRYGVVTDGPIEIGDDVWIGAGVIVLPKVHIGQGTIIGAGAVVTKDIPAHVVATGVPARVVEKLPPDQICSSEPVLRC